MNGNDSTSSGTALLESYEERTDDSLEAVSELGAFYPLISYPAPADDVEGEEALDPLIMAGLVDPRF